MVELNCKYCGAPIGANPKAGLVTCGNRREYSMRTQSDSGCGNVALYPGLTDAKFINLFNKAIYLRQHMQFERAAETIDYMISRKANDVAVYFERVLCNYGVVYSLNESIDAEHIICRRMNDVPVRTDVYYSLAFRRAKGAARKYLEVMADAIDSHQKQMQTCASISRPKQIAICYPTVESGEIKNHVAEARRMLADLKFSVMQPEDDSIETEIAHLFRAADASKIMIIVSDSPDALTTTENYDCFKRFMTRAAKDKSLRLAVICNNYDRSLVPNEFFDFVTVETHFSSSEELFEEIKKILFRISYTADEIPDRAPKKFEDVFNYIESGLFRIAKMYAKGFIKSYDGTFPYYLARLLIEYKVKNPNALADNDAIITAGKYYSLAHKVANAEERAQLESYARANKARCKLLYTELCAEYKKFTTYDELMAAAKKFKGFADIGESPELADECQKLALKYPYIHIHDEYFVKYKPNNSTGETVEIPETVTCIRHDAFAAATNLKRIVIPEGVTAIEKRAFYGCSSLTEVVLPSTLREIGASAFDGCSNLSKITFPDSLLKIGANAFHGCAKITKVAFPKSLARIGCGAFAGCASLASLTAWFIGESPARNNYFGYIFGAERFVQSGGAVPKSLAEVVIHGNHPMIPEAAFYNCKHIKTVVIPNSVSYIASNAFFNCQSLKSLPLPTALTEIAEYAFANCKSVTEAVLPDGVEIIAEHAFHGCDMLERLCIPDSAKSIGRNCLAECKAINTLTLPFVGESEDNRRFVGHLFGANDANGNRSSTPASLETVVLSDLQSRIPEGAFLGCQSLKRVTLPSGTTVIEARAFSGCAKLNSLTLPESVVSVGDHAFSDCRSLGAITLPDSIVNVGESAFRGCSSLERLIIPNGIEQIGIGAFASCGALRELTVPFVGGSRSESRFLGYIFGAATPAQNGACVPGNLERVLIDGTCEGLAESAFFGCSSLREVVIPKSITEFPASLFAGCVSLASLPLTDSVTSIADNCFEGCRSIVEASFSPSLAEIGAGAFKGCTAIAKLSIPETVRSVGIGALEGCSSLSTLRIAFIGGSPSDNTYLGYLFGSSEKENPSDLIPASLTAIELEDSVKAIPDFAFCGASPIKSILLPSNTESIGESAFAGTSIAVLELPESLRTVAKRAFASCQALEKIALPSGVTVVADSVFESCTSLREVSLPSSLAELGNGLLSGANSIVSLTLPFIGNTESTEAPLGMIFGVESATEHKKSIPASLKNVTLVGNIATVHENTFADCANLKSVTLPSSVREISAGAFAGCRELSEINLPEGICTIGDRAFENCRSITEITLPESLTEVGSKAFAGCRSITLRYSGKEDCNALLASASLPKTAKVVCESKE